MIVKHPSLQWACLSVTGSVKISLLQPFLTRKKTKTNKLVLSLCHRIASCPSWSARNVVSNCPTYSGLSLQTLPLHLGKSATYLKICVMTFILLSLLSFSFLFMILWPSLFSDNPSILNVFTLYDYCPLQNLFAFIQKETFEGLSQEALSFCIQSLKTASALITQRKVMSSPKLDQHQFSLNDLITSSRESLWDLIKWSPKGKCFDL